MPVKHTKRKKEIPGERKRRVRKHVIADLSANYVERFALLNSFSVECTRNDYGYDLNIYTFNDKGEFENGNIYIQLKATDKPKYLDDKTVIAFAANKKDLMVWYQELVPVIFILYDSIIEKAYWVYVQQYLRNLPNFNIHNITDSYTIQIPKANIINEQSFQQFRIYKNNIVKQITDVVTY